jgi:ABC-type nickel/cobalt efflux system permease component RcnA
VSRRRRIALAALTCALAAAALAAPQSALAHPLGNFTTNQLVKVRVSEGKAQVQYVLDQAEIPSFQQLQRYDGDGSGAIDATPERKRVRASLLDEISSGLELTVDGRPAPLRLRDGARLAFPDGQGGLSLTRLEASFAAPIPPGARQVELANGAFGGRVGWDAVQVLPGEGTDVTSSVPATDPTNGLRGYPQDLLSSPPRERHATLEVTRGSGQVTAPPGLAGGEVTSDRALDGFADSLAGGSTHGVLILFLLGAAFGWGALHALSPGHGKAMVAGYLVGARGTPRHAAILGLVVTATHTASVFALGLVTLAASQYILPERLYPWLGVLSGLLVVGIGLSVMRSRFRRWRAHRGAHAHSHGHRHGHGHTHSHGHRHGHSPAGEPLTRRGLIGLGISGGMVPCPSALVVLIAAISQHRLGLGMALIFVFSLGLAATLTTVGLAVVWGGRLIARMQPERRLFGSHLGVLPAISASVIVLAGVLITSRAIPQLG